jgi:hypothetical protein
MTSTGHVVGGRYRLVAELGAGGFGRVWRAHDETLGVDVAIKELRLLPGMSAAEEAERLARATREARNAARLRRHEHIVAIHDIVTENGLPWIVMELVDGVSLDDHVAAHGPLSADQAVTVAAALLSAIGAAHREGVVHRDIKPANVMIDRNGRVLITDFGTAVHDTDTTLTATGMLVGSPEYTAPERLRGTEGLPAGDLFSAGVTLYQAIEGVLPFRRGTAAATLTAVLMDEPPAPQRAGALTPLIVRLLDKDPARRPGIAEALALADVPAGQTTTAFPAATRAVPRGTLMIAAPGGLRPQVAVAGLLWFIAALGFVAYLGADQALVWDNIAEQPQWGVYVNAFMAGVLGAGIARLAPAGSAMVVGAVGFVAGGVTGGLVLLDIYDGAFESDSNLFWPAMIMFVVLLAGIVAVGVRAFRGTS